MSRRAERWPWVWFSIVVVLVVTVAGFAIAYVHASAAASKAQHVSTCINNILGSRVGPTAKDTEAHLNFAKAMERVLSVPDASSLREQKRAVEVFKAEVRAYASQLVADQLERDAKPLGLC